MKIINTPDVIKEKYLNLFLLVLDKRSDAKSSAKLFGVSMKYIRFIMRKIKYIKDT